MSNTPILITGCQRSGTTLLHLILNSHPDNHSIDETQFNYWDMNNYLNVEELSPYVTFKLPRYAPLISFIASLPEMKVIWCVRDPRDVVFSMLNLMQPLSTNAPKVSWAAHPGSSHKEITNGYWVLTQEDRQTLEPYMQRYINIFKKNPLERTRLEQVLTGALTWKIKNILPDVYRTNGLNFHIAKYEELVEQPKTGIMNILDYTGLPWHDNVLRHHEIHAGISVGKTDNTRPIDNISIGKWRNILSSEETNLIREICAQTAKTYGYDLTQD